MKFGIANVADVIAERPPLPLKDADDDSSCGTVSVTLQDECDKFTQEFVSVVDEATLILVKDFVENLKGTKVADGARKEAQSAPDFELPDQYGNMVKLSDLLKAGPVVLSFHRGSWCPYCSLEITALQRYYEKIKARGATVVAISPMTLEKTLEMTEEYKAEGVELPSFPLLSDAGNQVAKQYGLTFTMDETAHGWFKSLGGDLPAFNGDDSWTLPIPATYLVLPMERRISFAMVDVDYT